MKKILKAIFLLLLVIVLIAGGALFFFVKSLLPEQEEYIVYDKDKQIALIDAQLQGLDLEKIRAKAPLILDQSVEAIQVSITNKELTYEELTAFYLDRIKTYDTGAKGINAVAKSIRTPSKRRVHKMPHPTKRVKCRAFRY